MEVLLNHGQRGTSVLALRCTGDRGYQEKIDIMSLGLTVSMAQQDQHDHPHIRDEERFGGLS